MAGKQVLFIKTTSQHNSQCIYIQYRQLIARPQQKKTIWVFICFPVKQSSLSLSKLKLFSKPAIPFVTVTPKEMLCEDRSIFFKNATLYYLSQTLPLLTNHLQLYLFHFESSKAARSFLNTYKSCFLHDHVFHYLLHGIFVTSSLLYVWREKWMGTLYIMSVNESNGVLHDHLCNLF